MTFDEQAYVAEIGSFGVSGAVVEIVEPHGERGVRITRMKDGHAIHHALCWRDGVLDDPRKTALILADWCEENGVQALES